MQNKFFITFLFFLFSLPACAQLQDIHGVIPTENVTSLEIKPRYKAKDDSKNKTVATVEIKPSFKINQHWKLGAEIPFTRYFYKYQKPTASDVLEAQFMELELSVSERITKLFE